MNGIVFTNGCFDVIHPGHIALLKAARGLGSRLIVGINGDASVRAIKGANRPLQSAEARKEVLLGLSAVDEVRVFDELTPELLIREIRPDVLVKGADWGPDEIIGAEFVRSYGGSVHSLPMIDGFSTSAIVSQLSGPAPNKGVSDGLVADSLKEHLEVAQSFAASTEALEACASILIETFAAGNKVLICGNGGSAADAQHIAAEFVGRYENERRALPAIALTTDTSALTALANDYDFERIFSRQVEALANEGDCLIAISTSGNSRNVIAAVMQAHKRGCTVVGMTGAKGKKLAGLSDACLVVPSERTARIQECHILSAHIWCEMVEAWLARTA
jgi:D-sedoheptulose 7-phosphate isomerase